MNISNQPAQFLERELHLPEDSVSLSPMIAYQTLTAQQMMHMLEADRTIVHDKHRASMCLHASASNMFELLALLVLSAKGLARVQMPANEAKKVAAVRS